MTAPTGVAPENVERDRKVKCTVCGERWTVFGTGRLALDSRMAHWQAKHADTALVRSDEGPST